MFKTKLYLFTDHDSLKTFWLYTNWIKKKKKHRLRIEVRRLYTSEQRARARLLSGNARVLYSKHTLTIYFLAESLIRMRAQGAPMCVVTCIRAYILIYIRVCFHMRSRFESFACAQSTLTFVPTYLPTCWHQRANADTHVFYIRTRSSVYSRIRYYTYVYIHLFIYIYRTENVRSACKYFTSN